MQPSLTDLLPEPATHTIDSNAPTTSPAAETSGSFRDAVEQYYPCWPPTGMTQPRSIATQPDTDDTDKPGRRRKQRQQ